MRLRFGKPSLPLLMLFAALIGVIFYVADNWNNRESTSIAQTAVPQLGFTEPTPLAIEPISTQELIPDRIITRQEIPQIAKIYLPKAGVYSNVIQAYMDGRSWDVSQLRSKVGHLEGTAWVDEPGNVVLSGHVELADGNPGIFSELERVQVNDVVRVLSDDTWHYYLVTEVYTTNPTDLEPLMPTSEDRLTLITCNSYDFLTNAYLERVIVVAERIG